MMYVSVRTGLLKDVMGDERWTPCATTVCLVFILVRSQLSGRLTGAWFTLRLPCKRQRQIQLGEEFVKDFLGRDMACGPERLLVSLCLRPLSNKVLQRATGAGESSKRTRKSMSTIARMPLLFTSGALHPIGHRASGEGRPE